MNNFSERELIGRIALCYQKLSGEPLPGLGTVADRIRWLHHEAPYSLLAHNGGADPHFIYANECALKCFKYSREEILRLPSRLSAASPDQQERQRMLESLTTKGIVHGYSGMRITSQGESFRIYNGVIWQLNDDDGCSWGQAALFWPSPQESQRILTVDTKTKSWPD